MRTSVNYTRINYENNENLGKSFLSPDEIDQLITDVMQEFKEE